MNLTVLPETIGELKALEVLVLTMCTSLGALPDAIGELQALATLELGDCFKLAALPDSIRAMPGLDIRNWQGSPFSIKIKQLHQDAFTLGREVTGSATIFDVKALLQG